MSIRFDVVDPAATRELRRQVLRPDHAPGDRLPGDDLPDGVHLGAVDDDGEVLCTCFVYIDPCPWLPDRTHAWRLRQMATLPAYRGQGLGAGVVATAVELVQQRGGDLLWCNAREPAIAFYERLGFRREGAIFADGPHGIPHLHMWRELSGAASAS